MRANHLFAAVLWAACLGCPRAALSAQQADEVRNPLARDQLVAWCIVPFDAKDRTPAERARMLRELGLRRCAYDWRERHVPTFEQEILEYKKQGIEFFAFWSVHEEAFRLFEKHDLHPQIWITLGEARGASRQEKLKSAVENLLPLVQRTARMQCKLGLYNHGGWGGEPKNLAAVCRRLRALGHAHVGVVYNFHHGHGHIEDWAQSFAELRPFLLCLNLNGMNAGAEPKILGIGKGRHEKRMLQVVLDSGYRGPFGVLDHRSQLDAKQSLEENLKGLESLDLEPSNPSKRGTSGAGKSMGAVERRSISRLIHAATTVGNARRGATVFAHAKSACRSCHTVQGKGGAVGPDLSDVAKRRSLEQIVESLLWPQRDVERAYVVHAVATDSGRILQGYLERETEDRIVLRDPATRALVDVSKSEIESRNEAGGLMPDGLVRAMSQRNQCDLIAFLAELDGKPLDAALEARLEHAAAHRPMDFPWTRSPLQPENWPGWDHTVNRHRVFDFYAKQADHFRKADDLPTLLTSFPGLDGGDAGHWGRQNEQQWSDGRWNQTDLGTLQAGVFHSPGKPPIARGVCVRLGRRGEMSACFNPETLAYEAVWTGGFVTFSPVRHGFLGGLRPAGTLAPAGVESRPQRESRYLGYYRIGPRVAFAYEQDGVEIWDSPWCEDGDFVRHRSPRDQHPLAKRLGKAAAQWPHTITTRITPGEQRPYAVDTIEPPWDNPWKALLFFGGHDFLSNGDAMVCTMQGDVWRVSGLDSGTAETGEATWRRFASGLHHALGLVVVDDQVFVQCRDQLTRLHDRNGDGEADFYECFCNAFRTSPAGHDFICGLERDERGFFYTASGADGLIQMAPDGATAKVIATGFRNPDGVGLTGDGYVTVPCSEGEWTPASMICAAPIPTESGPVSPPHFGYRGPRNGRPPEPPLAYLPRGLDNSCGGQALVTSNRWGPVEGQMVHFSFGAGTYFLLLRDRVGVTQQGAVVPMPGAFRSGAHRGRFRVRDGQLYVTGMDGWVSFTPDDGSFQRVRYTGGPYQCPIGFHVYRNGVSVTFAEPVDVSVAGRVESHFAQAWNYRYSAAYGSPEYSISHRGVVGHDPLWIESATVMSDGRSVFLALPDLQPVSQLHLRMRVSEGAAAEGHELFVTAHALDRPWPGAAANPDKVVAPHPLLADVAELGPRRKNPWLESIPAAQSIQIQAGGNLSYRQRTLRAKAGQPVALEFHNPDVVPHNWALVRPGGLTRVGKLANQLISDPQAAANNYIPESEDVIAYTDVVEPGERMTIFFRAPEQKGRYPYLCTFPGHWMVMNGVMVVE